MGTRFIATHECRASDAYKRAIIEADEDDIVWTERITGVPVAVIRTPYVEAMGTKVGPLARKLLGSPRTKHWMRTWYGLSSLRRLKRASLDDPAQQYWQAGMSVSKIRSLEPAGEIIRRFVASAARARKEGPRHNGS
jgi:nitronate monooxygenase